RALCARLAAPATGPVCRCSLMAGGSAIADICEADPVTGHEGQAWVRLTRLFTTRTFPQPVSDDFQCTPGRWAAEFEVGVLRCAVGPDDEGQPPSAAQLDAEAQKVL